jgi:PAS domain S-box-containing protein
MASNIIERRYQLLTQTDDLIAISTPDRIRKYVNAAYCHFFEKSEAELVGTSFVDEFSEDKKKFYWEFKKQLTPENPSIFTVIKSGPVRNEKWIHWKENGIYDDNGELIEIITVGRNVDETIKTKVQQEVVTNMLKAYRDAIDSNIICSITDKKGIITYANKQFCKVSQYSSSELLGKSHNIINSGYHSKDFFGDMWDTILSGKMWEGDIRNRAKDGTIYWVSTVIIPVVNEEKEIESFLSLRVQITEKKQYEEERANYLRSLEDMIFMVSHELRKPITRCKGLLEILQNDIPEEEEYFTMIDYMIQSVKELDKYSLKMNDYLQDNRDEANRRMVF